MKTLITFILISLSSLALSQGELESLQASWIQARENALRPVDAKYIVALKALKDKFTKASKLEEALQVDAEIKKISEKEGKAPTPEEGAAKEVAKDLNTSILGKWIYPKAIVEIRPGGVAIYDRQKKGKWSIEESILTIEWDDGYINYFNLPVADGILSGRNNQGKSFIITKGK